jgi:chromosome segregation ATPase
MQQIPQEVLQRWPRLRELEEEVSDLTRRHQEAQAEAQALENQLETARRADLDREAKAVRGGKNPPKPKHEPPIQTKLEAARRNAEVYRRALEEAQSDLGVYRAEHRAALFVDLEHFRGQIARDFAKHAQAAAAGFGRWSDLAYTLKDLRPPPDYEAAENAPAVRSSTSIIGVQTRQSSGPARGEVEQMLNYLASLAPNEEGAAGAA